jgi:hypothetical protein
LKQRQRLPHGEQRAPDVDAEDPVEVLLGDLLQHRERCRRGVGEQRVQSLAPDADRVVEPTGPQFLFP